MDAVERKSHEAARERSCPCGGIRRPETNLIPRPVCAACDQRPLRASHQRYVQISRENSPNMMWKLTVAKNDGSSDKDLLIADSALEQITFNIVSTIVSGQ